MNDLTLQLGKFATYIKQLYSFEPMYYFINLSSLREYEWYASCLKNETGIEYCDIHSYPQKQPHYSNLIQIYDELPYTFMNVSVPIIYFVDYISVLQDNIIWSRMRDIHKDLVMDCHGSLVFLDDIITGITKSNILN